MLPSRCAGRHSTLKNTAAQRVALFFLFHPPLQMSDNQLCQRLSALRYHAHDLTVVQSEQSAPRDARRGFIYSIFDGASVDSVCRYLVIALILEMSSRR